MTGERLSDLHADCAIWGLDERAEAELVASLRSAGVDYDPSWERAAAMVAAAFLEEAPTEPAPAALVTELDAVAGAYFASRAQGRDRRGVSRP